MSGNLNRVSKSSKFSEFSTARKSLMRDNENISRPDWLPRVISRAVEGQWCTRYLCTTCGAWKFRSSVLSKALTNTGVAETDARAFLRRPGRLDFGRFDRVKVVEEIISELQAIDQSNLPPFDALTIILSDLEGMLGAGEVLDQHLFGTPVGAALSSMRRHEAELATERMEREKKERGNKERRAESKRRYEEWLKTKPAPTPRTERIQSGGGLVHIFLRSLEALSEEERLQVLVNQKWFALEVIPKELVPVEADVALLSEADRKTLTSRIDNRGGPWARLKRKLIKASISAQVE